MNTYKPSDIAEYIVNSGKASKLTNLKLQKILYFVYGLYWKETNKRLFNENFRAWKYGPVLPSVYQTYKGFSNSVISKSGKDVSLTDDDKSIIDPIIEVFGKSSAAELVTLSHLTDPWIEAFQDIVSDEISEESLHAYFSKAAL